MIRKRNKFWTIVFAMLPGAGHMFNGFMKRGVSIMALFFALWCIASWLNLGSLSLLAPVIWFYAFFDCINLRFQEDEDFYCQEDEYIFDMGMLEQFRLSSPQVKGLVGVGLVVVGVYALWNNVVMHFLMNLGFLPSAVMYGIREISYVIPQVIVGVLIVLAGMALIRGKKQQVYRWSEENQEKETEKTIIYVAEEKDEENKREEC